MSELQQNMELLRRYLDPSLTVPNGPAFHEPLDDDPNAEIKSSLISSAWQVMAAGESAMSGNLAGAPVDATAINEAVELLMDDLEWQKYSMLADACRRVLHSLCAGEEA